VVAWRVLWPGTALTTFRASGAGPRQSEARTNLGAVFVSEVAFFGENNRYSDFTTIGFTLAGTGNRYTYRSPIAAGTGGSSGAQGADIFFTLAGSQTSGGTNVADPGGTQASGATLPGAGGAGAFTATASGNIDGDATVDHWYVNDVKAITNDLNDVTS